MEKGRYYGKYQGFPRLVDLTFIGRMKCFCPEVMGDLDAPQYWLDWALPNLPWFCISSGQGESFVPQQSDLALPGGPDLFGVWLEFRHGDPRFPIWTGFFQVAVAGPIDPTQVGVAAPFVKLGPKSSFLTQTPLANGVVVASGVDPFTGASYFALGSASAKVMADK